MLPDAYQAQPKTNNATQHGVVNARLEQLQIHCFRNQRRSADDHLNKNIDAGRYFSPALSPLSSGKNFSLLYLPRFSQDVSALFHLRS